MMIAPLPEFVVFNEEGVETILFIHDLFGSSDDWSLVAFSLLQQTSKYHLLLPKLDAHEYSNPIHCTSALSHLIRKKAKDGVAHIVGLGIGAHIANMIAGSNGEIVRNVCLSGYYLSSTLDMVLDLWVFLLGRIVSLAGEQKALSIAESHDIANVLRCAGQVPLGSVLIASIHRRRKWRCGRWWKGSRVRRFASLVQSAVSETFPVESARAGSEVKLLDALLNKEIEN